MSEKLGSKVDVASTLTSIVDYVKANASYHKICGQLATCSSRCLGKKACQDCIFFYYYEITLHWRAEVQVVYSDDFREKTAPPFTAPSL